VSENCDQKSRFEALRKEFVSEFQRTELVAHKLVDDLTVISGYAEIMVMRGGPWRHSLNSERSSIAPRN
jgi:hypothetical protein